MPASALINMAKKSDKTKKELESYWKDAKKEAKKKGLDPEDDRFWAYVMGIVKQRAGLTKESIDEAYAVLKRDPVLRLRRIIEHTGDKASTLLLWESCKAQSLAWKETSSASNEQTMDYAFSILETATFYPVDFVSESFFNPGKNDKKRKKIDSNIRKLLSKDEMKKLVDDGYDIKDITDDELGSLETQLTKIKKDKNTPSFAGLLGTVVLGFMGGIAAAKAIDSFFTMFKD